MVDGKPKKRTFAAQNFEKLWQNRTQNKEMKGSKTLKKP